MEPTVASTEAPTQPPAPTPTPEPVETPRPSVPENTTGSSIVFERGTADELEVALTFDAGEGAGYTEEILDFLAENNLHASFGITGEWARAYPELVQRMVDEGHMLFNHSESHQSWTGVSSGLPALSEDQRLDELMGADTAVEEITGYTLAPFWRPPYGDYDAEGQELLAEYGYDYTLYWTCDTLAWSGTTPAEIAAKCGPDAEGGGPGAIILMHVTQEADYLSLEALVEAYEAEGYEFVTMEEMIAN
jgi:peptidoglycan/xylan/chitin deacetylase (PgdA/CDA1 family)